MGRSFICPVDVGCFCARGSKVVRVEGGGGARGEGGWSDMLRSLQ